MSGRPAMDKKKDKKTHFVFALLLKCSRIPSGVVE
jgi:hypothetical protein